MPAVDDALGLANRLAARATRAYLIGRGLAAEIDDARFPDDEGPIPAPHLDELITELGIATGEACNAGDRVAQLLDDAEAGAAVSAALDETIAAAMAAERITRSVAQVMLGVTSQLGWNDAIARGERAAVMVLHPVDADTVPLVDDGVTLHARHDPELITELCGALCRMIIDHDCELVLRATRDDERRLVLRVDAVENLHASADGLESELERLVDLGWDIGKGASVESSWDDPLSVVEPARLVLKTLRIFSPDSPAADVVARITASADDE